MRRAAPISTEASHLITIRTQIAFDQVVGKARSHVIPTATSGGTRQHSHTRAKLRPTVTLCTPNLVLQRDFHLLRVITM